MRQEREAAKARAQRTAAEVRHVFVCFRRPPPRLRRTRLPTSRCVSLTAPPSFFSQLMAPSRGAGGRGAAPGLAAAAAAAAVTTTTTLPMATAWAPRPPTVSVVLWGGGVRVVKVWWWKTSVGWESSFDGVADADAADDRRAVLHLSRPPSSPFSLFPSHSPPAWPYGPYGGHYQYAVAAQYAATGYAPGGAPLAGWGAPAPGGPPPAGWEHQVQQQPPAGWGGHHHQQQ